ncbi:MAG: uroporphyrinogen decarboxylase family protein [Treponemataceae bacterium]
MEGLELIKAVFEHKKTDRAPWVPFAGVHAGKLTGVGAKKILTDPDALVKALLEVNRLYRPDGQPVMFDLQIEAEILGCKLVWSDDGPPSVASHPLAETFDIPTKIPVKTEGRIPIALEAMKRMKKEVGGKTALYGLITGPFTLASHLRGTEIFMDMMTEQEYVHKLLDYSRRAVAAVAAYYIETGMDVIAVVDPLISQISPAHFAEFMEKPFAELFADIKKRGAYTSFFVCGNATMNIESMCRTKPDCISVDENVNLAAAKKVTDRYNVVIGGNLPLTTVMLLGNQQDNMKAVVTLADSLTPGNWIAAPGCDMPYDTPIENCVAAGQAVRELEQARIMVAHYSAPDLVFTGVLPDYAHLKKPLVEVFTLDSATCAACGYMLEAAKEAVARFSGRADIVEYKFTIKDNIARCVTMGVKQLPSLYLNGQLAYSSIIPTVEELAKKIEETL